MTVNQSITMEEAEGYINSIPKFTKKNTMEDTKSFLHRLGDPDRGMRIIHVAGTNGKGSVCAYMRSILEAAGYRVAVFTSPHLVDIRERFVVDGEMISKEDFVRIFEEIRSLVNPDSYHPSYFEYLFFMAMLYFREKRPDFCILETGLGGRLDATNSVTKKELSVITRIGMDHMEYLGNRLEEIAGEKAGIMHPDAPAVCTGTSDAVNAVFVRRAKELGISLHIVSKRDYRLRSFHNKSIDFSLDTRYYNCIELSLHTTALYQMENVSLAVRALEVLDGGGTISAEHIRKGISSCLWAGRMEEILPDVYLDGAHNEDGIRAFLESVEADSDPVPRTLLFAVVKDKNYEKMIEKLVDSGLFDRIAIAPMHTARTLSKEEMGEAFASCLHHKCMMYDDVATAFDKLLESRRDKERIYIAGSLYLAGEIKELLIHDQF